MARKAEVIFVGDAQSLIRASRQAAAATEKSGRQQEQVHLRLRKSFAGLTGSVTKMAGGFVAAYASIEGAKKAIDTTEELAHATIGLHRNLGMTIEQASRWAAVSRARGIDSKQLSQAFGTLSKNAVAVAASSDKQSAALGKLGTSQKDVQKRAALLAKGLGPQADAFKKLGLSTKDVQGANKNFEGFLHKVSDGLNHMGSGTERTALGMKLFGKGWQTVIPMLRGGSKAMDEQLKLADKYGVTFHGKTVKSLEELIQAQRESKFATMGLQVAMGSFLAPALTKALTTVNGFVKGMRDGTGEGGKFAAMLKPLADGLKKIFDDKNLTLGQKISKAFEFAAPMVADAAGKAFAYAAPRAVTSFVRAFKGAGPWGQLITVAFLLAKMGAFKAAGSFAAGQFVSASKKGLGRLKGVFVAAGAEAGAAGGLAEGEAMAGTSGLRSKKVLTALRSSGRYLGGTVFVGALALGIGAALPSLTADVLRKFKELVDPGSTKTPDMGDVLGTAPGSKGEADKLKNDYWKSHPPLNPQATGRPRAHTSSVRAVASVRAAVASAPDLLFTLEDQIAKAEAQKEKLQASFDRHDAQMQRAGLLAALRSARRAPVSGGGGVSLGGGGSTGGGGASSVKGKYGKSDLMSLWVAAGGDPKKANLMAAIALAESGGQAGIVNSIGATGLWQIHPGGRQYLDPMRNAQTAVMKLRTQGLAAWEAYTNGSYRQFIGGGARASMASAHGGGKQTIADLQRRIDQLNAEKRNLPSGKAGAGQRKTLTNELADARAQLKDAKGSSQRSQNIKDALKALKDYEREAGRAKKLSAIDLKITGLQRVQAFRDAIAAVTTQIHDKLTAAVDQFQQKWQDTTGKALDAANAAALDAFDQQTQDMVANGPAAKALAALQAQEDQIQQQAQDASNQQALEDAKRTGDPRAIAAAQAAIDETARQRAITQAQNDADAERTQIEAQRVIDRKAIEDQQAAARQARLDADTAAFQKSLDDQLNAELAQLQARKINYATFVKDVQKVFADSGVPMNFDASASDEAAINAGSDVFAPGVKLNPDYELVHDSNGKVTGLRRKGHAAGGYLGTVGELGPEDLYGMPNGRVRVMPASQSHGGGGMTLYMTQHGDVHIGNQRAAERVANRVAFRLSHG